MKKEKYCVRCGVSEREVRKMGISCSSWGDYWKRHFYKPGIFKKGEDGYWHIKRY